MDFSNYLSYLIPLGVAAFILYRQIRVRQMKSRLPELLSAGAAIVDVRTAAEFAAGSHPGSVNIPLNELTSQLNRLNRQKPVIVCCASGARSSVAASVLKRNGFDQVWNAGSWTNIHA